MDVVTARVTMIIVFLLSMQIFHCKTDKNDTNVSSEDPYQHLNDVFSINSTQSTEIVHTDADFVERQRLLSNSTTSVENSSSEEQEEAIPTFTSTIRITSGDTLSSTTQLPENEEISYNNTIPNSTQSSLLDTKSTPKSKITCPEITIGNITLPETEGGSWTTPKEICLNSSYAPVRIYCHRSGKWHIKSEIKCSGKIKESTQKLYKTLASNNSAASLDVASTVIKDNPTDIKPLDIYYISRILDEASEEDNVSDQFINLVDDLMSIDRKILDSSQNLYNSTDTILYSLDKLLLKNGNVTLSTSKLLVHTINASDSIIGAMIKNKGSSDSFKDFQIEYFQNENYSEILNNTNFEIAFIVPLPSLEQNHYFITLFYNDHLFSSSKQSEIVGSWIISILIPDNIKQNDANIKIYFKEFGHTSNQTCQYWKYGTENNVPIWGTWSFDGDAGKLKDGFYVCEINHTTHFGMLVSELLPDNPILELITIFGTTLSVIGISIIFVTALIFKKWRNKAQNKIILNVSICLLILIILFIVADRVKKGIFCISIGILLHYTVLAQLCWSLTISYSSYRRFHSISHNHISHVVMKFCIFSWGVPLLIVITTAAIQIQTYDKIAGNTYSEICYPKDLYFKLGVCLPMGIILTINLVIYILIMNNFFGTKLNVRKHVSKKSFSVQKSIILLFFMMGMTWVSGFLAAFTDDVVFVYLFCFTTTFHGFVIFLFYILDSDEMRKLWKGILKRIIGRKPIRQMIPKDRQSTRVEEISNKSTT